MLLVAIALVIILASCVIPENYKTEDLRFLLRLLGCLFLFILVLVLCIAHVSKDAVIADMKQEYVSIHYQAESKLYFNNNNVGLKQLADQITEWNAELAACKALKNSLWLNIFYPIDYEQFEFIDLEILRGLE